jgi:hypothetical protein
MTGDLHALGITMPGPFYIFGLVVFGLVGWVAFRHGRKTTRASMMWVGLATMLYPYFVPQTWLLWLIGAAATAWICVNWN